MSLYIWFCKKFLDRIFFFFFFSLFFVNETRKYKKNSLRIFPALIFIHLSFKVEFFFLLFWWHIYMFGLNIATIPKNCSLLLDLKLFDILYLKWKSRSWLNSLPLLFKARFKKFHIDILQIYIRKSEEEENLWTLCFTWKYNAPNVFIWLNHQNS